MGPTTGTVLRSLSTPSTNMSGRGVAAALNHVGTTASVSSIPPVDLMVSPVESPSMPQYPPPQPLLCGVYPPSATFVLPLSGCIPRSSCDTTGGGDTLLCQSALTNQPKSTVA